MANSLTELVTLWESREDVLRKAAALVKSNPKLAESLEMTADGIGQCAEELTECCNSQVVSYTNEDKEFLLFIFNRMRNLHDEDVSTDYMQKLWKLTRGSE